MKTFLILLISLHVFAVDTTAQTMKYVNEAYLQEKDLSGEDLQMVLSTMAVDGRYQLSNAYLSESDGVVEVGKKSNAVNLVLIPAAKINYVDKGVGSIQEQYIGADGITYSAPDEDWNKFAFFAQRETVQLYFLQMQVGNQQTNPIEKKYLTSIEAGKMNFQPAIAGNGFTAFSQMFAIQGNLNFEVFTPPYYGTFVFSPVIYYQENTRLINTVVGSDNLKDGPVIGLTTYAKDSLFVLSNNRNTCEFALIKANEAIRVSDVKLNKETITLISDNPDEQRITLTATVLPENAGNKSIRWISSNEDVAIVSETGEISAKSTGRAYISAISNDGMIADSCLVIVKTSSGLIIQENAIITDISGSIDFSFETPTTSIYSAGFNIQLPEGYRLIDNGINLADGLTSLSVNVVSVGDNEWKINLNPTESALTTQSAAIYKKILEINYTVDADLGNGSYEIILKNIDIKNENDLYIQEEQLIIPSNILRNTTANQSISKAVSVYCNNGELRINTNRIEKVQIYAITGALLYAGQINGTTSIPTDNFPNIFVVKSSSGWVKKIAKH